MKVLAAYLLASLAGEEVTVDDVKAILKAAGTEADNAQLTALFEQMKGKTLADVISAGSKKLQTLGGGGGGSTASAGSGSAAGGAAAEEPAAAEEEEEEEESEDMGFDLFG